MTSEERDKKLQQVIQVAEMNRGDVDASRSQQWKLLSIALVPVGAYAIALLRGDLLAPPWFAYLLVAIAGGAMAVSVIWLELGTLRAHVRFRYMCAIAVVLVGDGPLDVDQLEQQVRKECMTAVKARYIVQAILILLCSAVLLLAIYSARTNAPQPNHTESVTSHALPSATSLPNRRRSSVV